MPDWLESIPLKEEGLNEIPIYKIRPPWISADADLFYEIQFHGLLKIYTQNANGLKKISHETRRMYVKSEKVRGKIERTEYFR